MKKFNYRFEPLLKVKSEIEKQKQKEFSLAKQKVMKQSENNQNLNDNFKQSQKAQRQKQSGSMSVAEMLVYARYFVKLKRDSIVGHEMLRALNTELDKKRDDLLESSIEKKKYEKLKEILYERYVTDVIKSETKENDEVASNSYCFNEDRRQK